MAVRKGTGKPQTLEPNGEVEVSDSDNLAIADAGLPKMVRIQRIQVETILVPVTGTAPLISHRFDEKARKQMLEKQTARKSLREVRNPEAEYDACLYRMASDPASWRGDGNDTVEYGFPASAFRKATIGAARFFGKEVSMTGLRQMFMVRGEITPADQLALIHLDGKPRPREDTVRLPNGNAEVRFRAEFPRWSAQLRFDFVASSIDQDSLLSLIDAGGQFVGVGDWRPEKTGQFGTYEITGDIERVRK